MDAPSELIPYFDSPEEAEKAELLVLHARGDLRTGEETLRFAELVTKHPDYALQCDGEQVRAALESVLEYLDVDPEDESLDAMILEFQEMESRPAINVGELRAELLRREEIDRMRRSWDSPAAPSLSDFAAIVSRAIRPRAALVRSSLGGRPAATRRRVSSSRGSPGRPPRESDPDPLARLGGRRGVGVGA